MAKRSSTCWACKLPLREGQVKCVECESWQNWRRYASISNTTLALAVACLSVLVTLVSFSDRWKPRGVLVHVTGGENLSVELDVLNYETFPVKLIGAVSCGIGGNVVFPAKNDEESLTEILPDRKEFKVWANLQTEGLDSILKANEFSKLSLSFVASTPGIEGTFHTRELSDLISNQMVRFIRTGWKYAPSNLGAAYYQSEKSDGCTLTYEIPDGRIKKTNFSNPVLPGQINEIFPSTWKKSENWVAKTDN